MIKEDSMSPRRKPDGEGRKTIDHVAARCGFSRATISRVLNHEGSVKPATMEKVEKAIRELGYTPNSMAIGLSGGKSRTIAVLIPDVRREYYSGLLAGADTAAEELGYDILLKTKNNWKSLLSLVDGGRVDAFIIRNTGFQVLDGDFFARLENRGVPSLFIGKPIDELRYPSVLIDNVGGARLMAHHYVEHGFRRILFITGREENLDSKDRLFGFKLGLGEKGYKPERLFMAEGDFSQASGYEAARVAMEREKVDAIFAANDHMALGVICYCRDKGIRVPEDLAVTGFDDEFFAEYLQPALSTVQQPQYDIGAVAVRNVIRLLEGSGTVEHQVILPTRLQIRRSCGCSQDRPGSSLESVETIKITLKEVVL
jgi:DNA-binding LacI/PurR family transcriptional regulator